MNQSEYTFQSVLFLSVLVLICVLKRGFSFSKLNRNIIWFSNSTPGYTTKRHEAVKYKNLYSCSKQHNTLCFGGFHSNKKMKTQNVHQLMNRQTKCGITHAEYYWAIKSNEVLIYVEPRKHYAKWKARHKNLYIMLYDYIYMKHPD